MTRDELIALLARAVAAGWLLESQARALVQSGGSDDTTGAPLPLDEAVAAPSATEIEVALVLLVWLVTNRIAPDATPAAELRQRVQAALHDATPARRLALFDRATQQFADYARDRAESGLPTDIWHARMRSHLITLHTAAAELASAELDTALLTKQLAYLSRFADDIACHGLIGQPLSTDAIASRSQQYTGAARAQFYRGIERLTDDGYVVDYEAVDDDGTCSPCLDAEEQGPYLPGDGPMPGAVCRGRGRCRCTRTMRWAPDEAARLKKGS